MQENHVLLLKKWKNTGSAQLCLIYSKVKREKVQIEVQIYCCRENMTHERKSKFNRNYSRAPREWPLPLLGIADSGYSKYLSLPPSFFSLSLSFSLPLSLSPNLSLSLSLFLPGGWAFQDSWFWIFQIPLRLYYNYKTNRERGRGKRERESHDHIFI